MFHYLTKRIDEIDSLVRDIRKYISEIQQAGQVPAYLDFDIETMSYELPPDTDPDEFMDEILQMGASVKRGDEELRLPKVKEGSLFLRQDGRYCRKMQIEKKTVSTYGRTPQEAIEKMEQLIRENEAKLEKKKGQTLLMWVHEWMHLYKGSLKQSTRNFIQDIFISHLETSNLGLMDVKQVRPLDIEKFIRSIEAPMSRFRAFGYISDVMEKLVINRVIKENPVRFVEHPRKPTTRKKDAISYDEMNGFFLWLDEEHADISMFFRFLASTGLRRGEALALTWEDIDFEKNTISINKSYNQNTKETTTPKTAASIRTIPLFPDAIESIKKQKRSIGLIFNKQRDMSISTRMKKYASAYGINVNTHALRHYFTSQCYEAGIPIKVVQSWLGHTKMSMTLEDYTHITSDFVKEQTRKMALFWEKKGK